jgi:RecJ-like exonuclease
VNKTIKPFGEEGPEFPAKWEICQTCHGEGHRDNLGAFTSSDMDEWYGDSDERYEFIENYKAGMYDVSCEECKGTGKVLVPDLGQMTATQQREWEETQAEIAETYAIERMERMMGA